MSEQEVEVDFGGFFYTVDYILKLKKVEAELKEKMKSVKKQIKDADAQMMRQGANIVEHVKEAGFASGQVRLDDFMGGKHAVKTEDDDEEYDEDDE